MIENRDDLEFVLRRWGRVFGERPPSEWEEETSPYPQPLAQAMEFAPGSRDKRRAQFRDGRGRRAILAQAAGLRTKDTPDVLAPGWAADPIRGHQTRGIGRPWHPDPIAEVVELAALDLHAFDPWQGVCLRLEYCARGFQADKAVRAGLILERTIKLRRYRQELDMAKGWMAGHLRSGA
jgi:hypothetical protein